MKRNGPPVPSRLDRTNLGNGGVCVATLAASVGSASKQVMASVHPGRF